VEASLDDAASQTLSDTQGAAADQGTARHNEPRSIVKADEPDSLVPESQHVTG
jgi:hypothetical protein